MIYGSVLEVGQCTLTLSSSESELNWHTVSDSSLRWLRIRGIEHCSMNRAYLGNSFVHLMNFKLRSVIADKSKMSVIFIRREKVHLSSQVLVNKIPFKPPTDLLGTVTFLTSFFANFRWLLFDDSFSVRTPDDTCQLDCVKTGDQ